MILEDILAKSRALLKTPIAYLRARIPGIDNYFMGDCLPKEEKELRENSKTLWSTYSYLVKYYRNIK